MQNFHNIRTELIVEYFKLFPRESVYVSIGSGEAKLEKHLCDTLGINIICVDPYITPFVSFQVDQPCIRAEYNYVDDLIKDRPDIIGRCVLFLGWCEPGDNSYDYEAIIKLEPRHIVSVYGGCGAAGSQKFLGWINSMYGNKYSCVDKKEDIPYNYHVVTFFNLNIDNELDTTRYNSIVLSKNDKSKFDTSTIEVLSRHTPLEKYQHNPNPKEPCCIC